MVSPLHLTIFLSLVLNGIFSANAESSFQCFNGSRNKSSNADLEIGLEVSNRPTHQVMTRIFYMFLKEILGYENVAIIHINIPDTSNPQVPWQILDLVRRHPNNTYMNMINLEVWMPYSVLKRPPENITNAGSSLMPGRFGWFVPNSSISPDTDNILSLHYYIFQNMSNPFYDLYVMDRGIIQNLIVNSTQRYESQRCSKRDCVSIIAEYYDDTSFAVDQLVKSKSFVNIYWMGEKFRDTINTLYQTYSNGSKRFIVLHWTPSEIINSEIKFSQIIMPRCEDSISLQNSHCKYELTAIQKFYVRSLNYDKQLVHALREFYISTDNLTDIMQDLSYQRNNSKIEPYKIYNQVACNWLKNNTQIYGSWTNNGTITLTIGGIFPIKMTNRGHWKIVEAAQNAISAINNKTLLPGYQLEIMVNDGQCKLDTVMTAFIHYFNIPNVLGVLGPACSETVEAIAGISKHMHMMVMSYSAEGVSFLDRVAYPYFFRTIGSNSQYGDAYLDIMEKFGWKRIATLTENGQKYTEYISQMEDLLKLRNIKLIANRKLRSDATAKDVREHLQVLKELRAKIIIADIHNENTALVLCEAKKLKMTQREEYVWFFPSWLSKDFDVWQTLVNCTAEDLREAAEGHFSIRHTPFAELDTITKDGKTVKEWLSSYNNTFGSVSSYAGFAYDAVWAYALAAKKLLKWDKNVFRRLRDKGVANKFADLIWETNFTGLSGRVQFGQGGSRITNLDFLQWGNSSYVELGKFLPKLQGSRENLRTQGGKLYLNISKVHWSTGKIPQDGQYDCQFATIARILDVSCDTATIVFSTIICMLAFGILSITSFLFWKQRYDAKIRRSAKIMKNFGIDLLSPSRNENNTLDKWEIPKENVVINRRLGEGAFGTVYGGEAQLGSGDWTAVAVKTLKPGASTEDRLDFLSEAEAMKKFDHKNIIKLLAVCLKSEPIYTIMEFMLYGDLKTYLLARRNMVNEKVTEESDISPKRLTIYAMDVARGLAYLAEKKYVHRDLACRNCLVNSQRVVKIGDFGMARPTFESDYYHFNRKGMLPVRWMAPESLALGIFRPASDIWAFGVVMFEIVSFGSYPYQGLTNSQVLDFVKGGKTLQIPTGVKPQFEGLLKACWNQDYSKRPTAAECIDYISNYPRLLTPCLDFPGNAVEMPETESDQLELLPNGRKCSPMSRNRSFDILMQNQLNGSNNLQKLIFNTGVSPSIESVDPNHDMDDKDYTIQTTSIPNRNMDSFSSVTPDGYSIMSPLLMHHVYDSSDSSQAHLIKTLPSDDKLEIVY